MTISTEELSSTLEQATPGPWFVGSSVDDEDSPWTHPAHLFSKTYGAVGYWTGHKQNHKDERWYLTEADAKLIASSHSLAAEVLSSRARIEALEAALREIAADAGGWPRDAAEDALSSLTGAKP